MKKSFFTKSKLISFLPQNKWVVAFDALVVITIVAILSLLLFIRGTKKEEWVYIRVVMQADNIYWESSPPTFWFVDSLAKGMKSHDTLGQKTGEIKDLEIFDVGSYFRRAYVDVLLKADYDPRLEAYVFQAKPLSVGKSIDLTFEGNEVSGVVAYIGENPIQYKKIKIKILLKNIEPWVANTYEEGLVAKNSIGEILAKVDDVFIKPSEWWEFSELSGRLVRVVHPENKDVEVIITIKVFESLGQKYYVDRSAIKIGEQIWFQFPTTVIRESEIIEILD